MENNNLFYKIICCSPVLKKILSYLSIEDCCDFSKVCKTTFIELKNIKMNRITHYADWKRLHITHVTAHSLTKISFSNIEKTVDSKSDVYTDNPKIITQLIMNIKFPIGMPSERLLVKKTGEEINKYLKKLPNIRQLSLHVNRYSLEGCLVEDLMKEITNDKITVLEYKYRLNGSHYVKNLPLINDAQVFSGFSNLKRFYGEELDMHFSNLNERLLTILSHKEGLSFDINSNTLHHSRLNGLNRNIILNNKEQLSLAIGSKYNSYFMRLIRSLECSNLSVVRKLHLRIELMEVLCSFSGNLGYMTNLESLNLNLILLESEPPILDSKCFNERFCYGRYNNLKKLKSIKIDRNLHIRDILSNNDMENSEKESIIADFYEGTEFISEVITSFLCNGPSSVEKLCLIELPELTNKITSLLNRNFPNLHYLYLESIYKVEKDCIMRFNNLQLFESCNVDILEIPRTVNVCVVSKHVNHFQSEKFENCLEYYKEMDRYNKDFTIIVNRYRKILFNEFHEYLNYKFHAFF